MAIGSGVLSEFCNSLFHGLQAAEYLFLKRILHQILISHLANSGLCAYLLPGDRNHSPHVQRPGEYL